MSKETVLILLGLFIMALRTLLGVPGTWQTAALILAGGAVALIGFLLRGESLARGRGHAKDSFIETHPHQPQHDHGQKEGIGSLN